MFRLIVLLIKKFPPRKRKFKQWSELERINKKIVECINGDKLRDFPDLVYEYIHISTNYPLFIITKLSWIFAIALYYICLSVNTPNKIPLLSGDKDTKEIGWDYEGRTWIYWEHLFAKNYGWSREYIANLNVDVAIAHIQEIFTTQQLEREFLWGMSEIAYPYNSVTKKSKFSPLTRPYWMGEKAGPIKIVKIPKSLMPQGLIEDVSGMNKYVQEKIEALHIETDD